MKRLILTLVCCLWFTACAPAPTPAPTSAAPSVTPAGTRVPATEATAAPPGTPGSISIGGVTSQSQANGEVRTTARASAQGDLGLGQIEVSSPESMKLGDTRTVRLKISPASQLASSTPVAVPVQTPGLPGFVYRFSGNIQLYPVMIAELRAVTFVVAPTGPQRRDFQAAALMEWSWLVNAKMAGEQDLAISLQIPAIINGSGSEFSTSPLADIPVTIRVDAPPVNTPPASFWEIAAKSIADNTGPLLIALIGLIGTLIGILIKLRSDAKQAASRDSAPPKDEP